MLYLYKITQKGRSPICGLTGAFDMESAIRHVIKVHKEATATNTEVIALGKNLPIDENSFDSLLENYPTNHEFIVESVTIRNKIHIDGHEMAYLNYVAESM